MAPKVQLQARSKDQGPAKSWTSSQINELDRFIMERRPELTPQEVLEFREAIVGIPHAPGLHSDGYLDRRPSTGPGGLGSSDKWLRPQQIEPSAFQNPSAKSQESNSENYLPTPLSDSLYNDRPNVMESEIQSLNERNRSLQMGFDHYKQSSQNKIEILRVEKEQVTEMNLSLQKEYVQHLKQYEARNHHLETTVESLRQEIKLLQSSSLGHGKISSELKEVRVELQASRRREAQTQQVYEKQVSDVKARSDLLDSENRQLRVEQGLNKSRLETAYERIEKMTNSLQQQRDKMAKETLERSDKKLREERDALALENEKLLSDLARVKDIFTKYRSEQETRTKELERTIWREESKSRETAEKAGIVDSFSNVMKKHFPDVACYDPKTLDLLLTKIFEYHSQQAKLHGNRPAHGTADSAESQRASPAGDHHETVAKLRSYSQELEQEIRSLKRTINLLVVKEEGSKDVNKKYLLDDCKICTDNRPKLVELASLQEQVRHYQAMKLDVEYERERVRTAHSLNQGLNQELEALTKENSKTRLELERELSVLKDKLNVVGDGVMNEDVDEIRTLYAEEMKILRQIVACFLGWEINLDRDDDVLNSQGDEDEFYTGDRFLVQLRSVYVEANCEGSLGFSKVTAEWMEHILLGEPIPEHVPTPVMVLEGIYKDRYHSDSDTSRLLKDYKVSSSNDWYPHFLSLINIDDYTKRISRRGQANRSKS